MFGIRKHVTTDSSSTELSFAHRVTQEFEAQRFEFAAVFDAVRTIAAEIGEKRLGSYALVVGDDTSGRLPALILWKVINQVNARNGRQKVPITFIQTYSEFHSKKYLQRAAWARRSGIWKGLAGQRALVVTEFISSGKHLGQLTGLLREAGISFDVATLGSYGLTTEVVASARMTSTTRFFDGKGGILLYRKSNLTGLSSEKCGEPKRDVVPMESVAAARLHVKTIAEKVDQKLQQGLG